MTATPNVVSEPRAEAANRILTEGYEQEVVSRFLHGSRREQLNALTESIIGAALEVHQELGPGLLENAYQTCLAFEFTARGLSFERQRTLPVVYKNQR